MSSVNANSLKIRLIFNVIARICLLQGREMLLQLLLVRRILSCIWKYIFSFLVFYVGENSGKGTSNERLLSSYFQFCGENKSGNFQYCLRQKKCSANNADLGAYASTIYICMKNIEIKDTPPYNEWNTAEIESKSKTVFTVLSIFDKLCSTKKLILNSSIIRR